MRQRSQACRRLKWWGLAICVFLLLAVISAIGQAQAAGLPIGSEVLALFLILLGLFCVPTAWLWWVNRPFPSGHCQTCGYNLKGNVSGICPECGAVVPPPDDGLPDRSPEWRFPPGHCPMCGYSLTEEDTEACASGSSEKWHFCLMCKRLHEHRYPPGYCQECSYDLQGNEGGRCPECGESIDIDGDKQ